MPHANKAHYPQRSGKVIRRALPVVIGGAIAVWLASLFLNFNINVGWKEPDKSLSEQIGEKTESAVDAVGESVESVQKLVSDTEAEPTPGADTKYVGLSVADVLIDEDRYLLLVADRSSKATADADDKIDADRQPVAMYEVVRLARELPGEKSGIKVRIRRTATATAEAERKLQAALYTAQIPEDQIDFRKQLVE